MSMAEPHLFSFFFTSFTEMTSYFVALKKQTRNTGTSCQSHIFKVICDCCYLNLSKAASGSFLDNSIPFLTPIRLTRHVYICVMLFLSRRLQEQLILADFFLQDVP